MPLFLGVWCVLFIAWGCFFINPQVRASSSYHALHPYGKISLDDARVEIPWIALPVNTAAAGSLNINLTVALGLRAWSLSRRYLDNGEESNRSETNMNSYGVAEGLALGWPMPCMVTNTVPIKLTRFGSINRTEIITKTPYQIDVWGFFIDAMLYTILAFVLLRLPGVLRRYYRQRHGLCMQCGYPVGLSARCSECGETVPPIRPHASTAAPLT